MNITEKLTARICELVPGIKDIKRGCLFSCDNKFSGNKEIYFITALEIFSEKEFIAMAVPVLGVIDKLRSIEDCHKFDERILKKPFEIIGRDITLEDVLIAISKIYSEQDRPSVVFTPYKGVRVYGVGDEQICFWETGKHLHLQSLETQEAIYKLLT